MPKSSSWPCPSSATKPRTSPAWSSKETSWSLVPALRLRSREPRGALVADGLAGAAGRDARVDVLLVVGRRAQHEVDDLLFCAGTHVTTPTVSPSRSTVARSHRAPTSSRRCEMKMTERPVSRCLPTDLQHVLGKVRGQCRGHLIEQQDVRLQRQGASQVQDAQDGQGDVADHLVEVQAGRRRASATHSRNGSTGCLRSGAGWRARRGRG